MVAAQAPSSEQRRLTRAIEAPALASPHNTTEVLEIEHNLVARTYLRGTPNNVNLECARYTLPTGRAGPSLTGLVPSHPRPRHDPYMFFLKKLFLI
jgi:hypothetical protein